jgi:hypothetical protein
VYWYNEIQIKDIFGIELKHNHRYDKNLSFKKIFLGINILDKDYDNEILLLEDIELLDLISNFDPDSIIWPMNINVWYEVPYNSINSSKWKEKFINIIKKVVESDKKMNWQYFFWILKFLYDNDKIDKDFFNVIKSILLFKSKEVWLDSSFYDGIDDYIYIIEKHDKEFAKTILNNFNQKVKK